MTLTRRTLLVTAAAGVAASLLGGSFALAQDKPQIGIVVKIGGIPWFNAMEVGIKKEAEKTGADAWMVGPTQADAAQQVRAVEDLIARKRRRHRRRPERRRPPSSRSSSAPSDAGIKVLDPRGPGPGEHATGTSS